MRRGRMGVVNYLDLRRKLCIERGEEGIVRRKTIAGGIGALFLLFFTIWIASAHYNTGRYIYAFAPV